MLPIGLPALPLPGTPSGAEGEDLTVFLTVDTFGRWSVDLRDEYNDHVDMLTPFDSAVAALTETALQYPGATYIPDDEANDA